jgi:hypothetical protein
VANLLYVVLALNGFFVVLAVIQAVNGRDPNE